MPSLLEVKNVSKNFVEGDKVVQVIKDVSFNIEKNEIIFLVGPSGCGKTLLLRILTGLDKPDSGSVKFLGEDITPENPRVSNVFQSFALMPWLSVEENVSLGLEAIELPDGERARRLEKYLRLIGLTGSRNAYPRELSSGMKQRVGIARALAVEPDLVCMDEPFSSLDPLSAEALREEVLLLWREKDAPPDSLLIVSHSMEEAVYLADRIIVLSAAPSKIMAFLNIDLKRPRNRKSKEFAHWVDKLYSLMT